MMSPEFEMIVGLMIVFFASVGIMTVGKKAMDAIRDRNGGARSGGGSTDKHR